MALRLRRFAVRALSNWSSANGGICNVSSATFRTSKTPVCSLTMARHFSASLRSRRDDSFGSGADVYLAQNDAKIRQLSEELLEESLKEDDYFGLKGLVNMKDLFEAGVHYGHKQGMGFTMMTEYLLGHRFDTCIIDLNHTVPLLEAALNFIAHIAFRGGVILFVTNHRETAHLVETTAMECGEYAHTKEWVTDIFTESTRYYGEVTRLPDLVIVMSTKTTVFDDHLAVRDSAKMLIPTVGICDSNADPRLISYPVPGNDDSVASVSLFLRLFKTAILRGKTKRAASLVKEEQAETGAYADDLPTRERNEALLRQISALQEATKRSSETLRMEQEAKAREVEFDREDQEEKDRLAERIEKKKAAAKKKAKRTK